MRCEVLNHEAVGQLRADCGLRAPSVPPAWWRVVRPPLAARHPRLSAQAQTTAAAAVRNARERVDAAGRAVPPRSVPAVRRALGKMPLLGGDDRLVGPRPDRRAPVVHRLAEVKVTSSEDVGHGLLDPGTTTTQLALAVESRGQVALGDAAGAVAIEDLSHQLRLGLDNLEAVRSGDLPLLVPDHPVPQRVESVVAALLMLRPGQADHPL